MEIQQLKCYVAVANHGSFTAAAAALGLAQPSLSQAVSRLEAEFGTALFHRTSRGATLTSAGELLLEPVRRVLESVATTHAIVDALHGLTTGNLSVVAFKSFTTEAANVVAAFCKASPQVMVTICAPENDEGVYGQVASGACDAGFARLMDEHEGLDVQPVAVEESVALLPPTSAHGRENGPVTLAELAELPLIVSPAGTQPRTMVQALFAQNGLDLRVAAESDHHDSSVELVREGVGAYLTTRGGLPRSIDQLVTVRPLTPRRTWPIGLITRSAGTSPAVAAFRDVAVKFFDQRARSQAVE
jgi:DNA-binding transcriptional LysR family regulator